MSSSPVLLIFGSGANTGLATAKKFTEHGYKVAAVSRNPSAELREIVSLVVPADLSQPAQVAGIFEIVTQELGAPHVVIYNAWDSQFVSADNPLQVPVDQFTKNLAVNTVSAYAAACLAVKAFANLPENASKTFLYTGNMQNTQLFSTTVSLGVGKNASAYFIETAAAVYQGKYKFYFVDERTADGESVFAAIDGQAHAEEFWKLSQTKEQSDWCWTFVKDKGYVRNKAANPDREIRWFKIDGLPEGGIGAGDIGKATVASTKGK